MKMTLPYSYTSSKAEGLRLQILSEEQYGVHNPIFIETLKQAAAMGDVDAAKSMGDECSKLGDNEGALHWLKVADEEGNIDATCILLDLSINPGVNWDDIKYYAQRIIDAPYLESRFYKDYLSKAVLYLLMAHFREGEENSFESFVERIERLANGGDNLAQELMGRFCTSGWLKESTTEVAETWYLLSAKNGNARAQNEYAGLLLDDWSDKSVFEKAFNWQKKSAEAGYGLAQFNLAGMYFEGVGVQKDVREAIKWLNKASEQGNASAMLTLSELLGSGGSVPADLKKSREMIERAADCGEGNANLALALRLLMCGDDDIILREAGYRLIVGHKICSVDNDSDWRLPANQNRLVEILKHSARLKDRLVKALSFYTRYPVLLEQQLLKMFDLRAEQYKQQVNAEAEGVVVNLHYIGSCNFHCKTCYFPRDGFMLKLDSWKRIVDQIIASVRVKRFNFAGGEPLLAQPEFIQGLIDHIKSYSIDISIVTNGYCLTPEFIDRNKGKIGMIGISVDGINEEMNRKIGRATQNGSVLTNEKLYELADCIHSVGMRLKINTQVMKPTCAEDFHDLIWRIRPDKWKLLRTSIREDVNNDAKVFVTSKKEFSDFVERHADLKPIIEDSEDIKNAYYMVFQYGEFVYVDGDSHRHILPLMFGDVKDSLSQIPHNDEGYKKRYTKLQ